MYDQVILVENYLQYLMINDSMKIDKYNYRRWNGIIKDAAKSYIDIVSNVKMSGYMSGYIERNDLFMANYEEPECH